MDAHAAESGMQSHSSTITTLSGFPSWKSVRASAMSSSNSMLPPPAPSVLMALDAGGSKRELGRIEDYDDDHYSPRGASPRIRIKPASRPRSYTQIVEDFERSPSELKLSSSMGLSASVASGVSALSTSFDIAESSDEVDSPSSAMFPRQPFSTPPPSAFNNRSSSTPRRQEDTARRQKRFSMPALALQTTPVTARPNVLGEGKSKRFSLILGGKGSGGSSSSSLVHLAGNREGGEGGYGKGAAASKLQELLGNAQR